MHGRSTRRKGEPVLLLDPELDRAAKLAAQLELMGFPTRMESTGAGARLCGNSVRNTLNASK
jgi:phage replication-related protein YjqB (UPF0714/DUF867 family)